MGMFDLDEDPISLLQSPNKSFQTPILYSRVSSSLYHSMTIISVVSVYKYFTTLSQKMLVTIDIGKSVYHNAGYHSCLDCVSYKVKEQMREILNMLRD